MGEYLNELKIERHKLVKYMDIDQILACENGNSGSNMVDTWDMIQVKVTG